MRSMRERSDVHRDAPNGMIASNGPETRRMTLRRSTAAANRPDGQGDISQRCAKDVDNKSGSCGVDFSKLKSKTLRRYMKVFDLTEIPLYSSKEDLCRVVTEHFASQEVDEEEVIRTFHLHNQSVKKGVQGWE